MRAARYLTPSRGPPPGAPARQRSWQANDGGVFVRGDFLRSTPGGCFPQNRFRHQPCVRALYGRFRGTFYAATARPFVGAQVSAASRPARRLLAPGPSQGAPRPLTRGRDSGIGFCFTTQICVPRTIVIGVRRCADVRFAPTPLRRFANQRLAPAPPGILSMPSIPSIPGKSRPSPAHSTAVNIGSTRVRTAAFCRASASRSTSRRRSLGAYRQDRQPLTDGPR